MINKETCVLLLSLILYHICGCAISAQCVNYNPGQPVDANGVPLCPCGQYYAVRTGTGPSVCPAGYNGARCYSTANSIYSVCPDNPRCCCTNGGACCDSYGRYRPSSYTCYSSTGPCDNNVQCTGGSSGCPAAGRYKSSSTLCQASRGPCENNRFCTGSSGGCPTSYRTNQCATSTGPCESNSFCSGSSPNCPAKTIYGSGTLCRASGGACEQNAYCTTGTPSCPSTFLTGVCRFSQGPCENDVSCTGSSPTCPPPSYRTGLCRSSRGACEDDAFCSGGSAACPSSFKASGTTCSVSQGPCENDQTCSGAAPECPRNFKPSTQLCSASSGPCENDRFCTGTAPSCPSNFLSNGTVCRPARGPCETDGTCRGNIASCPASFKPAETVCKFSQGPCELNATCSGNNETCPASFRPPSHRCAASRGVCEDDRYCTGSTPECNLNFRNASVICASGSTSCEKASVNCSGSSHVCPSLLNLNGTICGNRSECPDTQLFCSGVDNICPLRACERCNIGFYGQDCSCTTSPPPFITNPVCNNTVWFSGPNETLVNDKVINIDGNVVIVGNFSQSATGITIVNPGTNLTVIGSLTPGGKIIVDLTNPGPLLNGGTISIIIRAGSVNGSGFSSVDVGNFVPPTCRIVETQQQTANLPEEDGTNGPKKGISILVSLRNDPKCDQERLIVIASSTSAAVVGATAAVIFAVFMVRRKREKELREETKDKLDRVQKTLTLERQSRRTKRFTQIRIPQSLGVSFAPLLEDGERPFAPPSGRPKSRRATGGRPTSHYDRKSRRLRRRAIHESGAPDNTDAVPEATTSVAFAPPSQTGRKHIADGHHHHRQRRHVHSKYNPRFSTRHSRIASNKPSNRHSQHKSHVISKANVTFEPPRSPTNGKKNKRKPIGSAEPTEAADEPTDVMQASFAPPVTVEEPVAVISTSSDKKKKRKAIISEPDETGSMTASFVPPVEQPERSSKRGKRRAIISNDPIEEPKQAVEMQLMTASYVAPITIETAASKATDHGIDYTPYDVDAPPAASVKRKKPVENDGPIDYTPYDNPQDSQRQRKSSIAPNLHFTESAGSQSPSMLIESYRPGAHTDTMESSFKPLSEENLMESSFKPPTDSAPVEPPKKSKRKAVFVDSTRSDK